MTIHDSHPFAEPAGDRDPIRQVRGRLGTAVSLWTAGDGGDRAGLTVSSYLVAAGDPAHVVGLVHPDSDLLDAVSATGRAVVHLLQHRHQRRAEEFAGLFPAPGGLFAGEGWEQTQWGPRLRDVTTWLGVRLTNVDAAQQVSREVGWSVMLDGLVEHVVLGEDDDPLVHRRGQYVRLHPPG